MIHRPPFSKVNKPGNILRFTDQFYIVESTLTNLERTHGIIYERIRELDFLLLNNFKIVEDENENFFIYAVILRFGTMCPWMHVCKIRKRILRETHDEEYPIFTPEDAITEMYQVIE